MAGAFLTGAAGFRAAVFFAGAAAFLAAAAFFGAATGGLVGVDGAPDSGRAPPRRRRERVGAPSAAGSRLSAAALAAFGAAAFLGRLPCISASTVSSLGAPAIFSKPGSASSMPRRGASTACTTNVRVSPRVSTSRARVGRGSPIAPSGT